MATGSLSIKLESTRLEPSYDLAITKAGEPAHLRGHHDCVVAPAGGRWKRDIAFSFAAHFNEFPSNIARDIESFRNSAPLRD